jgi:hypothetical protein
MPPIGEPVTAQLVLLALQTKRNEEEGELRVADVVLSIVPEVGVIVIGYTSALLSPSITSTIAPLSAALHPFKLKDLAEVIPFFQIIVVFTLFKLCTLKEEVAAVTGIILNGGILFDPSHPGAAYALVDNNNNRVIRDFIPLIRQPDFIYYNSYGILLFGHWTIFLIPALKAYESR